MLLYVAYWNEMGFLPIQYASYNWRDLFTAKGRSSNELLTQQSKLFPNHYPPVKPAR